MHKKLEHIEISAPDKVSGSYFCKLSLDAGKQSIIRTLTSSPLSRLPENVNDDSSGKSGKSSSSVMLSRKKPVPDIDKLKALCTALLLDTDNNIAAVCLDSRCRAEKITVMPFAPLHALMPNDESGYISGLLDMCVAENTEYLAIGFGISRLNEAMVKLYSEIAENFRQYEYASDALYFACRKFDAFLLPITCLE